LWKQSLDEQERHLTLEMPSSETAHAGKERERKPAKQQGKTSVTKAQQDRPVNVATNNRLL
jgi:hypothetical protein